MAKKMSKRAYYALEDLIEAQISLEKWRREKNIDVGYIQAEARAIISYLDATMYKSDPAQIVCLKHLFGLND